MAYLGEGPRGPEPTDQPYFELKNSQEEERPAEQAYKSRHSPSSKSGSSTDLNLSPQFKYMICVIMTFHIYIHFHCLDWCSSILISAVYMVFLIDAVQVVVVVVD